MAIPWRRRPGARSAGRVSVVVPLYNHMRYIDQAIASILAQGPIVREVIVIDDGSTDESAAAMTRIAWRQPRIRFRSQENRGAHATINTAMQEATGELLAICNSDDAYLPGRLERLARALDEDPEVEIAVSALTFMNQHGAVIGNPWHEQAVAFWRETTDMGVALINGNFLMSTSNFLFRRSLPERIGGFAGLRYTHDLEFALRVLALGGRIAMVDERLLRYRIHPGNTIAEEHRRVRADWAISAAAYLTHLWDGPEAPDIDWTQAEAVEGVLQRHELARAVHLCMASLRRLPGSPLDRTPLLADPAFRERVQGWV